MLFFWVYGAGVGLMAALSATRMVDNRQFWWLAAWLTAGATFAINQLLLFLNLDINNHARVDGVDLLLTLVTPVAVLLLGFFSNTRGPHLRPLSRVVLCISAGAAALALCLPALFMMQCAVSGNCQWIGMASLQ